MFGPLLVALWSFALYRERLTPRQAAASASGWPAYRHRQPRQSRRAQWFGLNRGDLSFDRAAVLFLLHRGAAPATEMHTLRSSALRWAGVRHDAARGCVRLAGGPVIVLKHSHLASFVYVCIFPSALGYLFLNPASSWSAPIARRRSCIWCRCSDRSSPWPARRTLRAVHAVGYALVFTASPSRRKAPLISEPQRLDLLHVGNFLHQRELLRRDLPSTRPRDGVAASGFSTQWKVAILMPASARGSRNGRRSPAGPRC